MKKMPDKSTAKKYFFNEHIFDDAADIADYPELTNKNKSQQQKSEKPEPAGAPLAHHTIDLPPLPPMFTQEELEAAKEKEFQRGKEIGQQETKNSRSEMIADAINEMSEQINLTSAHLQAEMRINFDLVASGILNIFEVLYPVFDEQYGFEQLKAQILQVLESQSEQTQINVMAHPDTAEGLRKFMPQMQNLAQGVHITIEGDDNIDPKNCTLKWEQGGAHINRKEQIESIREILQQILAENSTNRHDKQDTEQPVNKKK